MCLDDGVSPRLVLYASAPEAKRHDDSGVSFTYRYTSIALPHDESWQMTQLDELSPEAVDEQDLMATMTAMTPRRRPGVADPGIRWNRVDLSEEQADTAVAAVIGEFADLGGSSGPTTTGDAKPAWAV